MNELFLLCTGYWVCWYVHIHVYSCVFYGILVKEFRGKVVEIYKDHVISLSASWIYEAWMLRFLYILQKAKILHEYPPPQQLMGTYGRSKKKNP